LRIAEFFEVAAEVLFSTLPSRCSATNARHSAGSKGTSGNPASDNAGMRRLALPAVPLLAAGLLIGLPQAADAVPHQVCTVNEDVTYAPPLNNTSQTITVTVHGRLLDCTDHSTGTYLARFAQPGLTCTDPFETGLGAVTFTWSDGGTSVFSHRSFVTSINGNFQLELVGSITSGTFAPAPAIEAMTALAPSATACSTTGIAGQAYNGILAIG
jgi:hypothetical protein